MADPATRDTKDLQPEVWIPTFKALVKTRDIFRSILVRERAFPESWCADVSIALEIVTGHNLRTPNRSQWGRWSEGAWKAGGEEFLVRILKKFTEKGILEEKESGEYTWWRLTKEGRKLAKETLNP